MKEAKATIIVKVYPKPGKSAVNPIYPTNKQVIAMQELNFCCVISSGIYSEFFFFRKSFANFIIGLKLKAKPRMFATNGINNNQGC